MPLVSSKVQVQFTRAGNFRARPRMASPTGLKHRDMCRFFPELSWGPFAFREKVFGFRG